MQRKPQKILFPTITINKNEKRQSPFNSKGHAYLLWTVCFISLFDIYYNFFQRIKPRITNVSISYYRIEIRGKLLYDKIMAKSFTSLFIQFHLMCLHREREEIKNVFWYFVAVPGYNGILFIFQGISVFSISRKRNYCDGIPVNQFAFLECCSDNWFGRKIVANLW